MTKNIPSDELRDIERMVHGPSGPMAFGGAYDGAARFDREIASWDPGLGSADLDMLPYKDTLDARSRDLARNDAYVQAGGTIHKDGIVGSFFLLNAKPGWKTLGKDEAWAEAFQQEVEEKFTLWAESPMKWVDAAAQNDFTAMVRLAVGVSVLGGEVLATAEYVREKQREYRTAIQMIDCDRLTTPYTMMNDSRVRGGIKHDRYGRQVSAFIRTTHPMDYRMRVSGEDWWKEVDFRKPWGRQQVIYLREQQRVDQSRAVADISAGLREIAITRKFRDVTLQNAVVNAMYAASIESELPPQVVYEQLGGASPASGVVNYAEQYLSAINSYVGASKNMMIDGVRVPHLFPGTKLQMRPAGSPGGVGQDFEKSLLRYIAATLGVSYEELSRDFSQTNYSSARAAMAGTWRYLQSRKKVVADAFANAVYRLWIEEAVNNDRLDSFPAREAATLYTNDHLNLKFDALTQCDWIGAARGQIDELKETQAAVLRIKYGLSTHEDELARLGKDWRKVYTQMEREAKERDARNIVLYEDNSVNAASGTPRQDEQDGTGAKDDDAE
jgi:lambda family phage portal protein